MSTTPQSPEPWDQASQLRLAHADTAYKNAQEVVRFVDSKINILILVATAGAGFCCAFGKWLVELPEDSGLSLVRVVGTSPPLALVSISALLLSLLGCPLAVVMSMLSVIARPQILGFTILFPILRAPKRGEKPINVVREGAAELELRLQDLSSSGAQGEYANQLSNLGWILSQKISYLRKACWVLLAQFALLTAGGMIYLLVALSGAFARAF